MRNRPDPTSWPKRTSGLEKLELDWCDVDKGPDYAAISDMFLPSLEELVIVDPGKKTSYIMPFLEHLAEKICSHKQEGVAGSKALRSKALPMLHTIDLSQWWGSETEKYAYDFRAMGENLIECDVDKIIPDGALKAWRSEDEYSDQEGDSEFDSEDSEHSEELDAEVLKEIEKTIQRLHR